MDGQIPSGVPQPLDQDEQLETDSPAARNPRFIGDLNPEALFLAATSPDATRGVSLDDSIGVW